MTGSPSRRSMGLPAPKGLADLPPKILEMILDRLYNPVPRNISNNDYYGLRDEREAKQKVMLRTLSLVNDGVRKLAQPLLWKKAYIGYNDDIILQRARKFEQIFSARPESTKWPKTLTARLYSHTPLGAEALDAIAKILSRLDGVETLILDEIFEALRHAPPQLFANVTDLRIARTRAPLDDIPFLISRCQSLTRLSLDHINAAEISIGAGAMPLLTRLKAPIGLAALLVPGRPIEDLTITPSQSLPVQPPPSSVADLASLAGGTKPLRCLRFKSFEWSDGAIQEIARYFPSLEKLDMYIRGNYNAWLESNLLETVRLLPSLQTVKMVQDIGIHKNLGNGPPSAEKLEVEMQDLKNASAAGSRLKTVSFLPDVTWLGDDAGFWFALYTGIFGRTMFLTPRDPAPESAAGLTNTQRPERHPNDRFTSLPTELLLDIVSHLRRAASQHYTFHLALLALCLTCETLRSVAQPALFNRVHLRGKVRETLFVARKLEAFLNTREGSAEWVKELVLQWEGQAFPGGPFMDQFVNQDPQFDWLSAEMVDVASRLMTRMTNIRELKAQQIEVSQEMYAQLHELPMLEQATFSSVIYTGPPSDARLRADTLPITRLSVLHGRTWLPLPEYTMPREILQLAQGPALRELCLWRLTPEVILEAIGPGRVPLVNLQDLEISDPSSVFQTFLDFAPYTPNLESLTLGTVEFGMNPVPTARVPTSIPPTLWPHLKRFTGSLPAAQLFAPSRPLQKLEITGSPGEEVTREALVVLARGSGHLKYLSLTGFTWRTELIPEIAALFPDTETLRIFGGAHDENWLRDHLEDVVGMLPNLRAIQMSPEGYSETRAPPQDALNAQARAVVAAKALRLSLIKVSFNGIGEWDYEGRGRWTFTDPWKTKYGTPYLEQ